MSKQIWITINRDVYEAPSFVQAPNPFWTKSSPPVLLAPPSLKRVPFKQTVSLKAFRRSIR